MELFQVLEKHDINQSSTIDRSELSAALNDVRKYFFKLNRVLLLNTNTWFDNICSGYRAKN